MSFSTKAERAIFRAWPLYREKHSERDFFSPNFEGKEIIHYTSMDNLMSIVTNHCYWLTNSQFLNDVEEIAHGPMIVKELVGQHIGLENEPMVDLFLTYLTEEISNFEPESVYISSFTDAYDSLDMWRGYGRDKTGVAIVFDRDGNSKEPNAIYNYKVDLLKVIYNEAEKKSLFSDVIEIYLRELKQDLANNISYNMGDVQAYCWQLFSFLYKGFIICKNEAYLSEREIRAVYLMTENSSEEERTKVHFRSNGKFIIPYVKSNEIYIPNSFEADTLPIRLPINRILIGPTPDFQIIKKSVETLLRMNGYDGIPIESSKIPLREVR